MRFHCIHIYIIIMVKVEIEKVEVQCSCSNFPTQINRVAVISDVVLCLPGSWCYLVLKSRKCVI